MKKNKCGVVWLLVGTSLSGCADGTRGSRPPLPDEIPALQRIPGGKVLVGLELSPVREERTIASFQMTTHPISVRRYKQCLAAGACDAPALASAECRSASDPRHLNGPTFGVPDGDELPITCVKPEQALAYCRWQGGNLPDSTHWLAAARGATIRRYAWGDSPSECEQHPEVRLRGKSCDASTPTRLRIGAHAAGVSPTGVEDVLLTPGELVATSRDSFFAVCGEGASACIARGLSPGSIDGFAPVPTGDVAKHSAAPSVLTYGFRCAIEDK